MADFASYIGLVDIKCEGCEYTSENEVYLRSIMSDEPFPVYIRGQRGPAAGPDISCDVVIFIAQAIASGLVGQLATSVFLRIRDKLQRGKHRSLSLRKAEIRTNNCSFVVLSSEEVSYNGIDYEGLLRRMAQFAEAERANGRNVSKIEAPCRLEAYDYGWKIICDGEGNYSLWKVEYTDGKRWPYSIYDAANEAIFYSTYKECISEPLDLFRLDLDGTSSVPDTNIF